MKALRLAAGFAPLLVWVIWTVSALRYVATIVA